MAGLYGLTAVSATAMARSDLAAVHTPDHGEFPADIVDFSASQLSLAIRLRKVSCEEVTNFLSCRPVLTDSSGVATR